jgi:radical SAM protein with 4Fe4S-binding SPASM domain
VDEGEPFSPHKILNHFERVQALVAGESVFPVTVEIDPSNKCNHRCQWCVSAQSHTGEQLEYERFVELIAELESQDVRSIVLKGGGEPTVHPRINDMLQACADRGLAIGLITNGSMPRQGTPQAVLDTAEWVRISIDAALPATHRLIHGTADFNRILRNVEYLTGHAKRTLVGLNFVADQRNYREIVAFAQLARSVGAAYASIRCAFSPEAALPVEIREEMRRQASVAKKLDNHRFRVLLGNFTDQYLNADPRQPFPWRRCLGPNLVGIVGADGEVYACCFLRGNKAFSFGNVNDQSFEAIWAGPRRREVMARVDEGACERVCMGGMTSSRYNAYNDILNYLMLEEKQHADFI